MRGLGGEPLRRDPGRLGPSRRLLSVACAGGCVGVGVAHAERGGWKGEG